MDENMTEEYEDNFFQEIYEGTNDDKYNIQVFTPKTECSCEPTSDGSSGIMLDPNHPLLQRFQQTLKDQLLRQIEKLSEEVAELETGIKTKTKLHNDLGVAVYDAQIIVNRQQESLDDCEKELNKISSERKELENDMINLREKYQERNTKLQEAEKSDVDLRNEIESMSYLMRQMTEWQDRLESDISVNQRIADKSKVDKRQFSDEKRNYDFFIYKLMSNVYLLESNIDHLNLQLEVKERKKDELADKIAEMSVLIEGVERDHKRLMYSWNATLLALTQRDKTYFATKAQFEEIKENLRLIIIEKETLKKLCNQEMARNEQLTLIKGRIDVELVQMNQKLSIGKDKLHNIEIQLSETHAILDQTEKDYDCVTNETKVKENELMNLNLEISKQTNRKIEIEEKVLHLLEQQITNDKTATYMNKQIRELRNRNEQLELELAKLDNQNGAAELDAIQQDLANSDAQKSLNEINNQINEREHELQKASTLISNYTKNIEKKRRHVEFILKQIEEIIKKNDGAEMAPDEIRIKTLEKAILEKEEKSKELQAFWLRQQTYVVSLTEKRHKQLNEINLLQKQLMLITQKNLTLEDDMEKCRREERQINTNIENLHYKLHKLNAAMGDNKGIRQNMDKESFFSQNDYYMKLKDAELECIRMENEITDIEEDKMNLSKQLIEVNREVLAWERKTILASETKQHIEKERGSEGELSAMKAEIHRMSVRHGQLRKAQEKLIQDLDHCVLRRESIMCNAEATEKRAIAGKANNRLNFKRKIEDVKLKIKKIESERKAVAKQINDCKKMRENFELELQEKEEGIKILNDQKTNFEVEIENAQIERQKELEILLFKQHMVRAYSNISINDYKMMYRTETQLNNEYAQQQEMNGHLQTIVETLMDDFPNHRTVFAKILNTLKLTSY